MTRSELSALLSHATAAHEEKAELLCRKYSSFLAIAEASLGELAEVLSGDMKTSVYIKLAVALNSRRAFKKLKKVYLNDEIAVASYITSAVGHASVETVYLISFDNTGKLIAADKAGEGTVNASTVIPRRLLELAKHRGAHTVAVAHNHPSGEAVASQDDVSATEMLRSIFFDADICFHGGYVVAGGRCVKM